MAGRKPKPTAVKKLEGNPGKRKFKGICRTLLVEFNDAYSLGAYGLPDIYYAKLISARWSQLLGVKDEFHF